MQHIHDLSLGNAMILKTYALEGKVRLAAVRHIIIAKSPGQNSNLESIIICRIVSVTALQSVLLAIHIMPFKLRISDLCLVGA